VLALQRGGTGHGLQGARHQRVHRGVGLVVGLGHHQDRRRREAHDLLDGAQAAAVGHGEVDGDDVGLFFLHRGQRLVGPTHLLDHADVTVGLQHEHQALPLGSRVLDDHDAYRAGPRVHTRPNRRSTASRRLDSSKALFTM
jgi:hypothetical protein